MQRALSLRLSKKDCEECAVSLRGSPVEPPLSALRETSLLQCLFGDFVNPGLSLQRPHSSSLGGGAAGGSAPAFLKYASLLVTLCVRGAYESTARWWEARSLRRLQTKAAQWQYEAEEDFEVRRETAQAL